MHTLVSELRREKKIFIADYDSYTIIRHRISGNQLSMLSKIGLLLFDRLMLPAAFFWQSDNMHKLLLELEPAIEIGLVLPVIRDYDTTTDIIDYYNRRIDESEKLGQITVFQRPELASEIAAPQHERYVKLLDETNVYAHLDQYSVREMYISNWLNDLENHVDINSLRLLITQASIPIEQIPTIIKILQGAITHPQFSRSTCIDLVQKILPEGRCKNLIEERVSWLYLKSNADAYESSIYYSYNPNNGMIFGDNLRLLSQTLSVFGLTEGVINQLTINDVLHIKMSSEYQRFIVAYRDIISNVHAVQENFVSQIQSKIVHEIKKETRFSMYYKALNIIQAHSVGIFVGLIVNYFSKSDISTEVLIGSGSAAVVSCLLKKIDSINSTLYSLPFCDFKNYVITKQYEKTLREHIEGNL